MSTLADVARRAGVSTATASRIINGSAKPVTDGLRQRVLAAVAELQYVPNAQAQMLARSHRSIVGVIVHDVSDPYFAEITRGIQRVATEHGRLVIICNTYRDPGRELEYIEVLHAHQAAAIIMAGSGYHDPGHGERAAGKLRAYQKTGGQVTVIGRHEHAGDAVLPDNEGGGFLAGDHLFGLGHTEIGVVAGPRNLTTTTDRLNGLRRAARRHKRKVPAGRIVYADFDRDSGAEATSVLLAAHPQITAIAALNDSMAVGVLACLRTAAGIASDPAAPDRWISVIGFDDMPIARDVTPALTSVRLPLAEMGARAMALALSGTGPGADPRIERLGAELIRRDSTRAV